jgi:hypothetical protein
MAVYQTYNADTNKEDLTDVLTEIGQMDTPVFSGLKKVSAKNSYHEWSTYDYASAADNSALEGATFSYGTLTSPSRVGNWTQIFTKTFQVSETQRAVDPAGMEDEYAFRVKVALKEIGRDIEKALIQGTGHSGSATSVTRKLKGILAYITDNISTGTGQAASAASSRSLSETELNGLLQDVYSDGGSPDWLLGSFRQKRAVAELASSNRRYVDGQKTFTSAVDVYESPFGMLRVDGDSQMDSDTLCALSKDMWAVAQLRPVKKVDTALTADAKNGALVGELTLEARADKYNGKLTSLIAT